MLYMPANRLVHKLMVCIEIESKVIKIENVVISEPEMFRRNRDGGGSEKKHG